MQAAEEQGRWELDLWNGSAWFSDWFRQRLQWPAEANCNKLDVLRPHLAAGAWDALLLAIRAHLERQVPLELEIGVRVNGEWQRWQVRGSVERSPAGQPVYLGGTMHDVRAANDAAPTAEASPGEASRDKA